MKNFAKVKVGSLSAEVGGGSPEENRKNMCTVLWGLAVATGIGVAGFFGFEWVKNHFKKDGKTAKEKESASKSIEEQPYASETLRETIERSEQVGVSEKYCGLHDIGGIHVVFSQPGVGKSILAMQEAIALANGKSAGLVPNEDEQLVEPMDVVYFDGELTATDIEKRYANILDTLSGHLHRVPNNAFNSAEEMLNAVKQAINKDLTTPDGCIFIDNITYLLPTQNANDIRYLFDGLKKLIAYQRQQGKNLTIFVIAHTNKNNAEELTLQDLAGSGNISSFANTVFALSDKGNDIRELKPLKHRCGPIPVSYLKLVTDDYIHFEFSHYKEESPQTQGKKERRENVEWTEELLEALETKHNNGEKPSDIAKDLSSIAGRPIFYTQVVRKLKELGLT